MQIALIDNYDSFTYNLYHYVEQFANTVKVFRNDEVNIKKLNNFDKILLSPGSGLPSEKPNLFEIIDCYQHTKPILGVCLGLQAIFEFYGGKLINLNTVLHGISTQCSVTKQDYLFNAIPQHFKIGHYHSWVGDVDFLPKQLEIIAVNDKTNIMAIRHKELDIRAVQFHPESVLTDFGLQMIENWVKN